MKFPKIKLTQSGLTKGDPFLLSKLSDEFLASVYFKEGIIWCSILVHAQEIMRNINRDDTICSIGVFFERGLNSLIEDGLIEIKLTRKGKITIKKDIT